MGREKQVSATDFTPRPVFVRRASSSVRRGDQFIYSSGVLLVAFNPRFDDFVASVAYELRTKIVYRTDNGKFARGLVRASSELEAIHQAYLASALADGGDIRLVAHFYRRQDPRAFNRWMMSIRFTSPDWHFFEEETVKADAIRVQQGQARKMELVLGCAALLTADIAGEPGKRIRRIIDLADRVGYPANLQLWYYNRELLRDYLSWRTSDPERKRWAQATGGRLPFDGYVSGRGNWRVFPFQGIFKQYSELDPLNCSAGLKKHFIVLDDYMFDSLENKVKGELARTAPLRSELSKFGGGDSVVHGSLAEIFFRHLGALQASPNHLYSAYK